MCLLQVGEYSTSYLASARVIERVSLLTKRFCLFCHCLCNLGVLKLCVVHCRLLLVRLDCLLQFFTSGLADVGAGAGDITHLTALQLQQPTLSGALGTEPEVPYARLLVVRVDILAKMDNRTNRVVLGSNLSIQLVVDASYLFSSASPDFVQFKLQIPLLRQLLSRSCRECWFHHTSERTYKSFTRLF